MSDGEEFVRASLATPEQIEGRRRVVATLPPGQRERIKTIEAQLRKTLAAYDPQEAAIALALASAEEFLK